eukprot:Colp12_sorted_trinity150504_noHs@30161
MESDSMYKRYESEPVFQPGVDYYEECRQMWRDVQNLLTEKTQLESRVRELENKRCSDDDEENDSESTQQRKRHRRTFAELDRKYTCTWYGCGRVYASEGSLNQHVRLKHTNNKHQNNTPLGALSPPESLASDPLSDSETSRRTPPYGPRGHEPPNGYPQVNSDPTAMLGLLSGPSDGHDHAAWKKRTMGDPEGFSRHVPHHNKDFSDIEEYMKRKQMAEYWRSGLNSSMAFANGMSGMNGVSVNGAPSFPPYMMPNLALMRNSHAPRGVNFNYLRSAELYS